MYSAVNMSERSRFSKKNPRFSYTLFQILEYPLYKPELDPILHNKGAHIRAKMIY